MVVNVKFHQQAAANTTLKRKAFNKRAKCFFGDCVYPAAGVVQVRDFVTVRNTVQLRKLLKVLGTDFAISQNPHMRKGGLIGLAAMAIGLGEIYGGVSSVKEATPFSPSIEFVF